MKKIISIALTAAFAIAFAAPASAWQQSQAFGGMTDMAGFTGSRGMAGSTGTFDVSASTSTFRGNTAVENSGGMSNVTAGNGSGLVGGTTTSQGFAAQGWHSSFSTVSSETGTLSASHGNVTSITNAGAGGQALACDGFGCMPQ